MGGARPPWSIAVPLQRGPPGLIAAPLEHVELAWRTAVPLQRGPPGLIAAPLEHLEQAWSTAVPLGAVRGEDPVTGLTATERELLRLLGAGPTDEAAGRRLGLSLRTVRRHTASIMERLGAGSRFEAGIKAARRGRL